MKKVGKVLTKKIECKKYLKNRKGKKIEFCQNLRYSNSILK